MSDGEASMSSGRETDPNCINEVSKHFTLRHTRAVKEVVVKGLKGGAAA